MMPITPAANSIMLPWSSNCYRCVKAHHRQDGGHVVAAVEGLHRVFVALHADNQHADDGGDQTEGAGDEREHDALNAEDRIKGDAQNHRADVFGGGGFEQVGAAAGAVADVVAHQVRDHGGVAGVVFGDTGFHFTDQVGADVGGLRVDAAAQLGEQRHEARAETECDDLEGH